MRELALERRELKGKHGARISTEKIVAEYAKHQTDLAPSFILL